MIRNAKIEGTMLGMEDHGILTFFLHMDYGDSTHQGAGGYALDGGTPRRGLSLSIVRRILEVVGVEKWEDLKGRSCRVRLDSDSPFGGTIRAVGHYLRDDWIEFEHLADIDGSPFGEETK